MANLIRTVYLIGLGAVGATYGSLLYRMNPGSIKVVADEERLAALKHGITVNGEVYPFECILPKDDGNKAEFIIVSVKGHHLPSAIESIAPLVGENTLILSLLNGITSEEDLSGRFGRDKVLHGFCVGTDAVRENGAVRFTKSGRIVFGEHYKEVSGKAFKVSELFSAAGIAHTVSKDIRREMWWKFMMNVGLNQTSAILKAPYGVYQRVPEARELMAEACREVIPLAAKEGILLSEADIEEYFKIIDNLSPAGKTSMLQDVEAGRKTEVESFALTVIQLGKKHGVPAPVNETLYRMIRVIEAQMQGALQKCR